MKKLKLILFCSPITIHSLNSALVRTTTISHRKPQITNFIKIVLPVFFWFFLYFDLLTTTTKLLVFKIINFFFNFYKKLDVFKTQPHTKFNKNLFIRLQVLPTNKHDDKKHFFPLFKYAEKRNRFLHKHCTLCYVYVRR